MTEVDRVAPEKDEQPGICLDCLGTGVQRGPRVVYDEPCPTCGGTGSAR